MSLFNNNLVAEGYKNKRPYFHPIVINKIKDSIGIQKKLGNVLDVGCGTGLSTVALKEISEHVVGTDISKEMIDMAQPAENVEYYNYPAEDLRFEPSAFDLITLAGSINWINRDIFLYSANKLLKPGCHLVIYDNYIFGEMKDNSGFIDWYKNIFLVKYPRPPRNEEMISNEEAQKYNFTFQKNENYTNDVVFTLDGIVNFLTTLSNITVVAQGDENKMGEIKLWLSEQIKPFFATESAEFVFGGYIWYLRKISYISMD